MKKPVLIFILASILVGVLNLPWLMPEVNSQEEQEITTEVPVHAGEITRETLRGYVIAYGTVGSEPAGEHPAASAHISPAVAGVVTSVTRAEGDYVNEGDVLFILDDRVANVAVDYAQKSLDREKQLIESGGTSQKLLEAAEQQFNAARVQKTLLNVTSPLSGTLTRVNVTPGQAVNLTTDMAEVIDLDRLVIMAGIPSTEIGSLKKGQAVEIYTDNSLSYVNGTLNYIGTTVDTNTGTISVRASLPAGAGLNPGQFVRVRIINEEHQDILTVPEESVVEDDEGMKVISIIQGNVASQKTVKTGLSDRGRIEVEADNLQPGMRVVTEGAYALPPETRVRILENR